MPKRSLLLAPKRCVCCLELVFFKIILRVDIPSISYEIASVECYKTSLMTSQHWLLSGVPDFFDRNKILSGGDLSHYQVHHYFRVFFYFV